MVRQAIEGDWDSRLILTLWPFFFMCTQCTVNERYCIPPTEDCSQRDWLNPRCSARQRQKHWAAAADLPRPAIPHGAFPFAGFSINLHWKWLIHRLHCMGMLTMLNLSLGQVKLQQHWAQLFSMSPAFAHTNKVTILRASAANHSYLSSVPLWFRTIHPCNTIKYKLAHLPPFYATNHGKW